MAGRSKAGTGAKKGAAPRRKPTHKAAHDREILYGYHSVFEALKAFRRHFDGVMLSLGRSDKRGLAVAALAEKKGCRCNIFPKKRWRA